MGTSETKVKPRRRALTGWVFAALGALMTAVGAPLAFEMFGLMATPKAVPDDAKVVAPDILPPIFFTVGILLALAGVGLTLREQYLYQTRVEALEQRRSRSVTRFTDELGSTLDVLVDYSRSDGMRAASESLVKNVLREGRRLYAHPGVRLCLYMLETAETEAPDDQEKYLVLREYDGRRDAPRAEFSSGAHSACLIQIALGNRAVAVTDPSNPPAGISVDHTEHSGWKSYLAVPLIRGREQMGVLLVDTRDTTEFTDEDKSIGWTISRLLVHGLRATERKAMDLRPELSDALAQLIAQRVARLDGGVGDA